MASSTLTFGLAPQHYASLAEIFSRFPEIQKVLLYGSRARGTASPGSDFDLAIVAPDMNDARFSALWNALDALPLIFKLDVVHIDRLPDGPLRRNIDRDGLLFYPQPRASLVDE